MNDAPRSLAQKIIAVAVSLVVALVALEALARGFAAHRGRSLALYRTTRLPVFWIDINPYFGVWHPAATTFHHVGQCFDVSYRTNSYGARDIERARVSQARSRHVVLGDSFVEGYGVGEGERLTDRLNVNAGEEFLNFGTAGGFGTIQELVLYRTLAASFDHSDVLLFVLPVNDFSDNDPKYWPPARYRPYLRPTTGGFEVYYTVPFESRDRDVLSSFRVLWNVLSNRSVAVNLGRQAIERRLPHGITPAYTSYVGHSAEDLDLMSEAIRELAEAAQPRPLHVFLIPLQEDLDGFVRGRRYELPDELRTRLRSARTIAVHDLLPDFADYVAEHHVPTSSFFLPCDGHWTSLGNAVAAAATRRDLRE